MFSAVVQIKVIPKRMLDKKEAAHHCGRPVKRFDAECPVHPVRFPNGDLRYDVNDLDAWINSLKAGVETKDIDALIERLGA